MIEDLVRAADDETERCMSDARRLSVLLSQQ